MKVAIVHDWLTNPGGAEKVVLTFAKAYPDAPIFTSVYDPAGCPGFEKLDVRTTYLQKIPLAKQKHQFFPILRSNAFRKLDLSEYDLVLSSSSADAKAIQVKPGAIHICYCHTPTRYYWSHYEEYVKQPGFGKLDPMIRPVIPPMVKLMRKYDLEAASRVTYFIANSTEVKHRIKTYYHRDSAVLYPPVDTKMFNLGTGKREGFIVVGRQVPYKRIDLAVAACSKLGLPLTVIGDGSEHHTLQSMAGPTVRFLGRAPDDVLAKELAKAQALIFPSFEDAGITPLDAMASGTPVIAYGQGGVLDSVVPGKTGMFFDSQTTESLMGALKAFNPDDFDAQEIRAHAEQFDESIFIQKLHKLVDQFVAKSQATTTPR
jgi:glycosyltransferase involved in cell wall biosynthesis